MIGARASPGCELCKRERNMDLKTTNVLPTETVEFGRSRTGEGSSGGGERGVV
jgi:hypothetical protein